MMNLEFTVTGSGRHEVEQAIQARVDQFVGYEWEWDSSKIRVGIRPQEALTGTGYVAYSVWVADVEVHL